MDKAFNYKCIKFFKFYIQFVIIVMKKIENECRIFNISNNFILHSITIYVCNHINVEVQYTNLYIYTYVHLCECVSVNIKNCWSVETKKKKHWLSAPLYLIQVCI